jgi:hypothetical protein
MGAMMKTVLLRVHDDAGQKARLQAALDLTRALNGHLTGVEVTPLPNVFGDFDGVAQAMTLEEERKLEMANRIELEMRLAHEEVAWDWIDATMAVTASLDVRGGFSAPNRGELQARHLVRDRTAGCHCIGCYRSTMSRRRSA